MIMSKLEDSLPILCVILQSHYCFQSPEGDISWEYFKRLHKLQEEAGLRAANKLSVRHILWQQQKMKVSLAAQTFSNSVAQAMILARDLGLEQFQDCLPTVTFIKVRIFNSLIIHVIRHFFD